MSFTSVFAYKKILLLHNTHSYLICARIAVCLSLATLLCINDTTEILALPAKNIRQTTLLSLILSYFSHDNLPVFRDYWILSSIRYLSLFSLILASCGIAIRTNLIIGAITYTLHYHHIISYTHFFHSGLIPLQILYVLCLTNHDYNPNCKNNAVLSNQVAIYCIYITYGLSYFCAGLSKLKVTPFWGLSDNLKIFMLSDSLSLVEYDFNLAPKYFASGYAEWPILILGIATVIVELSGILIPFYNKARKYCSIAILLLHVGIFLGHEFIFIDLCILPIILFAPFIFCKNKILNSLSNPKQEYNFNLIETLTPWFLTTIILSGCFFKIEQFPIFTAWGMYATNNQDKERVTYLKI
jgi:hypothetical protein